MVHTDPTEKEPFINTKRKSSVHRSVGGFNSNEPRADRSLKAQARVSAPLSPMYICFKNPEKKSRTKRRETSRTEGKSRRHVEMCSAVKVEAISESRSVALEEEEEKWRRSLIWSRFSFRLWAVALNSHLGLPTAVHCAGAIFRIIANYPLYFFYSHILS